MRIAKLPALVFVLLLPLLMSALAPGPARAFEPTDGWRNDAPGTRHQIEAAAMPAPGATKSVSNAPRIVPRTPGLAPLAPPGFVVTLFAEGLHQPRVIRVAPNGDVFVAESGAGQIRVFPHVDAHHVPPKGEVFANDLDRPYGIAFGPDPAHPQFVYVGETGHVLRYPYQAGDLHARAAAQTILADLPVGGHWTRDVAFSADGARLFVAIGSRSNIADGMPATPPGGAAVWQAAHGMGAAWGDEAGRAEVAEFRPDGTPLGKFGGTLATGLRNCAGLAMAPGQNTPWCVVNERDGLGDNLPPDYLTHVEAGQFYGWPWFYIGDHPDPRRPNPPDGLAAHITTPPLLFQPHSAPLGAVFYEATQFGAEYRGDVFVTLHGSWNRATRTGAKVVRVPMHDGKPAGYYQDFLTGFVVSDDAVWGRPVGIAVSADGSLLVSEDANGTIWRVSRASD